MTDLVYLIKTGNDNEDLRTSLRSISKLTGIGNVWIVGYKPSWVSGEVGHIPVLQESRSKNRNTNRNLEIACCSEFIGENFVLMNDDFIYIGDKGKNILDIIGFTKNKISEQIQEYSDTVINSIHQRAFIQSFKLIRNISGVEEPLNWELHIPMTINKNNFLDLFARKEVRAHIARYGIILKRSLYGNCFSTSRGFMDDVKLRDNDCCEFSGDWISVFDIWIGNDIEYPKLNKFLKDKFWEKCKYEK